MSQNTPIIGSGKSGLEYRNLDNDAKKALLNHHKGSAAPAYMEAGCIWLDDSATPWELKIYDGNDWLLLAKLNESEDTIDTVDLSAKEIIAPAVADYLLLSDTSNSGALGKATVSGLFNVNKSVANEYTKTQNFNATVLTDAETIDWDLSSNQVSSITLSGNRTLNAPTNQVDGATYILIVKQDSTGSRTLAFNSVYKFADGNAPILTTTADAVDILTFVSDGTYMYGAAQLAFA